MPSNYSYGYWSAAVDAFPLLVFEDSVRVPLTTISWVRFSVNTYSGEINHRSVCAAISSCRRIDAEGRTIWIVDAHSYGKRFIARGDEMLIAFVELQRAIDEFAVRLDPLMAAGTCVPMKS